jgi:hypothetical protein
MQNSNEYRATSGITRKDIIECLVLLVTVTLALVMLN